MSYIWSGMILLALFAGAIGGNLDAVVSAGLEGASEALETVFSFAGLLCFWNGFLRIAEAGSAADFLGKLFAPFLRRLFPRLSRDSEAMRKITLNLTANLLGCGNAATPAGVDAMAALDRINPTPEEASEEMCLFTVLNTASVQLVPTTIISIRAAAGAANPSEILIPVWIVSLCSLLTAVFSMKYLLYRERTKKTKKKQRKTKQTH